MLNLSPKKSNGRYYMGTSNTSTRKSKVHAMSFKMLTSKNNKRRKPIVRNIGSQIMSVEKNEDSNKKPHWSVIKPDSTFRKAWDVTQIFILTYVCIFTPYVAAFTDAEQARKRWTYGADLFTDVFYAVDIVLNFRTAFIDVKTGGIIYSDRKIFEVYFKGWFLFDIMVTIPWDHFLSTTTGKSAAAKVPRLLRILRLSRIAKIARLLKVNEMIEFVEDRFQVSRNYIVVCQLLGTIWLVAHFTACGFYFVATLNANYEQSSWIYKYNLLDTPELEAYIASLYWSFTMMTTVGFGDIVPVTHIERLFSIGAMLVSAGTYAFMIASMSSIVAHINITKTKYFEKLNELNAYMLSREVPTDMQLRVRKYYRYYLKRKTVYNEKDLLDELPTNLREELTDHYIRDTINNVQFFHDVERGFTGLIAMHLKPTFYSPNSVVINMGDVANEFFIITKGVLQVFEEHQDTDQIISYLHDGDNFGEMALLLEEQCGKRNASVRSQTYCELHVLEYTFLQIGLSRYTKAMEKLLSISVARKALLLNLRKSKVVSLVHSVQKKALDKKFKSKVAGTRFKSGLFSDNKSAADRVSTFQPSKITITDDDDVE